MRLAELWPKTTRARLLWLAISVQVVMFALLIGRTAYVLQDALLAQTKACIGRMTPALEAALIAPMLQEDVATVQSVVQLAGQAPGISYLAVLDPEQRTLASVGWGNAQPLPKINHTLDISLKALEGRLDATIPLAMGKQPLGEVRVGLNLLHIAKARNDLLLQAGLIALLALAISLISLSFLGHLLTRRMARLTEASERIARGEFEFKPLSEGADDVGRMGAAFNAMSQALRHRAEENLRANELLRQEKELLQVTLGSIGDAVMSFDPLGRVVYLNPAAEALTGWRHQDAVGLLAEEVLNLLDGATETTLENPVRRCLREKNLARLDANALLLTRDGRRVFISDTVAPITNLQGEVTGVVLAFQDVSAKREMLEEMHWQANHDALTGLMNRRSFEAQLRQLIEAEYGVQVILSDHALMYIDLDQFKIVNDTSGHMAGDELLRQVTFLMQQTLRKSDVFARLGGDEFGVLLPNCPEQRALEIADALRAAVHDFRFVWRDKVFQVGVSIGLVMLSQDMHSMVDVLSAADVACYAAKEEGRNRVHVYRADDAAILDRRRQMNVASSLRESLREDRFVLMAQEIHASQIDPQHPGVRYFEVLLRMRNENGEIMPADSFIPAAERYGVMPHIDRWVVRHVLRSAAKVLAQGEVHLGINLSGLSLIDPLMPEFIRLELLANNIDPRLICFEITETSAISYISQGVEFMRQMQALGCQFALDDFGSGMASFGYLKSLPVQCLKIDGTFVRDMLNDPLDRTLVESIQHIGKVMGMRTIAEYAETEAHVQVLRSIGIDFVQGFALSRPRLFSEVLDEMRTAEPPLDVPNADAQGA